MAKLQIGAVLLGVVLLTGCAGEKNADQLPPTTDLGTDPVIDGGLVDGEDGNSVTGDDQQPLETMDPPQLNREIFDPPLELRVDEPQIVELQPPPIRMAPQYALRSGDNERIMAPDEAVRMAPLVDDPGSDDADSSPQPLVSKEERYVKVFYGTNRNRNSQCDGDKSLWTDGRGCTPNDFYGTFTADYFHDPTSRHGLEVGTLTVTFPEDHTPTQLERPFSVFGFPLRAEDQERDVVIAELESYSTDYDRWIREVKSTGRKQAFIYVHGFANSFASAARRAAQVAYDLDFDIDQDFEGLTMMFSWPSQGSLSPLAYASDYDASDQAREAFNEFLDLVASEELDLDYVHVIAHSMGNRLVTSALDARQIDENNPPPPIINELVLAAPDVPALTFRSRFLKRLPQFASRVTLYVSDKDVALYASSYGRESEPRAGQVDGGLLDVSVDRFDAIDTSPLDTDFLSHDYYASNQSMLADIQELLRGVPAMSRLRIRPNQNSFLFLRPDEPDHLESQTLTRNPLVLWASVAVIGLVFVLILRKRSKPAT